MSKSVNITLEGHFKSNNNFELTFMNKIKSLVCTLLSYVHQRSRIQNKPYLKFYPSVCPSVTHTDVFCARFTGKSIEIRKAFISVLYLREKVIDYTWTCHKPFWKENGGRSKTCFRAINNYGRYFVRFSQGNGCTDFDELFTFVLYVQRTRDGYRLLGRPEHFITIS